MATEEDLLDIQARLRRDSSGVERQRLREMLAAVGHEARRRADAGMPPAEYRLMQSLVDAVESADQILIAAWRRYHGDVDI